MKTSRVALLCTLGLLLTACSTMDERRSVAPPERAPSSMDADDRYIAHVERVARRRGIQVTWVHAPRRRPAESARTR